MTYPVASGTGACNSQLWFIPLGDSPGKADLDCNPKCEACSARAEAWVNCDNCTNGCLVQWGKSSFTAQCQPLQTVQFPPVQVTSGDVRLGIYGITACCGGTDAVITIKAGGKQLDWVLHCECPQE